VGGGGASEWAPDGRTVYYAWSGRIMKVKVDPRSGDIGRPEVLNKIQPLFGWTVARDGRFLIGRASKSSERHSIKVVLHWSETLRDTGTKHSGSARHPSSDVNCGHDAAARRGSLCSKRELCDS